jgi:hypothetical protein
LSDWDADLFLGVVDTFLPFSGRPLVRNTKLSVDSFLMLQDPSSDREPDPLSTDVGLYVLGRGFLGGICTLSYRLDEKVRQIRSRDRRSLHTLAASAR